MQTDEQNDVLVSLGEVLFQLQRTKKDISNWKWAIIALTCAVNGALTCNLSGTMEIGALTKKWAEKTIAYRDSQSKIFPNQHLASPQELFQRAIGASHRYERAGKTLTISAAHEDSFLTLFDLRNQFIHFRPTGWSIEVSGLPSIFLSVMLIIEETINDQWSFRHLDPVSQKHLNDLSSAIFIELEAMIELN